MRIVKFRKRSIADWLRVLPVQDGLMKVAQHEVLGYFH
jgi:hypothetical protein